MEDKIREMLKLQMKLNNETNGECWLDGITKEGREINWYRCIYMETAEAIDSLNWKHWKDIKAPDDIENLKIELVDIWHFVMSELLFETKGDYDYNTSKILHGFNYMRGDSDDTIESLENLLISAINRESTDILLSVFTNVLYKIKNFDFDELYKMYIGKNVLNQFRQDNGYKEGTYKKIWDGQEDNVVMMRLIEGLGDNLSFDSLYTSLRLRYIASHD